MKTIIDFLHKGVQAAAEQMKRHEEINRLESSGGFHSLSERISASQVRFSMIAEADSEFNLKEGGPFKFKLTVEYWPEELEQHQTPSA